MIKITKKQIEQINNLTDMLAKGYLTGNIQNRNQAAVELQKAYAEIYKANISIDKASVKKLLEKNCDEFSAGKVVSLHNDMKTLPKTSTKQILEDIEPLKNTYNDSYLVTEAQNVISSDISIKKWESAIDMEKKMKKTVYLKYRTINDDRVREEHEELDGITLPITDSFWDIYTPPNDWNCRCTVLYSTRYEEVQPPSGIAKPAPEFAFNPGKESKVFSEKTTYMQDKKSINKLLKKGEL